jgi:hypothetical protein
MVEVLSCGYVINTSFQALIADVNAVKRVSDSSHWYISPPLTSLAPNRTGYAPSPEEAQREDQEGYDKNHKDNFAYFSPRMPNILSPFQN